MKQFTLSEMFEYRLNELHNEHGITIEKHPGYFDQLEVLIDRLKVFEKLQHELTWYSAQTCKQKFDDFFKENFF